MRGPCWRDPSKLTATVSSTASLTRSVACRGRESTASPVDHSAIACNGLADINVQPLTKTRPVDVSQRWGLGCIKWQRSHAHARLRRHALFCLDACRDDQASPALGVVDEH